MEKNYYISSVLLVLYKRVLRHADSTIKENFIFMNKSMAYACTRESLMPIVFWQTMEFTTVRLKQPDEDLII